MWFSQRFIQALLIMSTLCKKIELYKGGNDWEAFTIAAVGLGGTVSLPQLESFSIIGHPPTNFYPSHESLIFLYYYLPWDIRVKKIIIIWTRKRRILNFYKSLQKPARGRKLLVPMSPGFLGGCLPLMTKP